LLLLEPDKVVPTCSLRRLRQADWLSQEFEASLGSIVECIYFFFFFLNYIKNITSLSLTQIHGEGWPQTWTTQCGHERGGSLVEPRTTATLLLLH
jgi:hypothetical protein